jgi:hypothetical protein
MSIPAEKPAEVKMMRYAIRISQFIGDRILQSKPEKR